MGGLRRLTLSTGKNTKIHFPKVNKKSYIVTLLQSYNKVVPHIK